MSKTIDTATYLGMTSDQLYQAAKADAETCSSIFHSAAAKQLSVMQRKRLIQQYHLYLNNSMHSMTTDDDLDVVSFIRYELLMHKLAMANEVDKLKEYAKKHTSAALYLLGMISFSEENKFNLIIDSKDNAEFTTEFVSWLPQDFIYNICKEDPYKLNLVCRHSLLLDQLTDEQLHELVTQHELFLQHALHSTNMAELPEPNEKVLRLMQILQSSPDSKQEEMISAREHGMFGAQDDKQNAASGEKFKSSTNHGKRT